MITTGVALLVGWLILNPLKLIFVSCCLEDQVKRLREKKKQRQQIEDDWKRCYPCCKFMFINRDQIEMMKDLLAVIDYVNTPIEEDSLVSSKSAFIQIPKKHKQSKYKNQIEDRTQEKTKEVAYSQILLNQDRESPKARAFQENRQNGQGQQFKTYDQAQTPLRGTLQTSALQSTQSKNPQSLFSKTVLGPRTSSQVDRETFTSYPQAAKQNNFIAPDRNGLTETNISNLKQTDKEQVSSFKKHPLYSTQQQKPRAQGQRIFQRDDKQEFEVGQDSSGSLERRKEVAEEANQQTLSFLDEEVKMMDRQGDNERGRGNSGIQQRILAYTEDDDVEDGVSEDSDHKTNKQRTSQKLSDEKSSEGSSSIISKAPLDQRTRRVDSDTLQLQVNPSVVEKIKQSNNSVISFSRLSEIKESPVQRKSIKSKLERDRNKVLLRYLQDQDLYSGGDPSQNDFQRSSPSPVIYILPENRREPEEEDGIDQSKRRREQDKVGGEQIESEEEIFNDFEWDMESFRENSPDLIEKQRRQEQLASPHNLQASFSSEDKAQQKDTPESPYESVGSQQDKERQVFHPWQKQSITSQLSHLQPFPQAHNYELRSTPPLQKNTLTNQNNAIQVLSSGLDADQSLSREVAHDHLNHKEQRIREDDFENEQSIKESSEGINSSSQSAALYSAKDHL